MAVGDKISSSVWGNQPFEISQEFGTYSADTAAMYPADYTVPLGWPAGTHIGLDVKMPKGTRLFAANFGKIIGVGPSEFFRPKPVHVLTTDNPATKKNEGGYEEIYGHMWTNSVRLDQQVKPGDYLGTSGEQTKRGTMEPDGTGEHLHFELRRPEGAGKQKAVNPRGWLTESQFDTDEDTPTEQVPEDTNTETTGNVLSGLDIGGLGDKLTFVVIGVILLAFGVITVLRA
jgi:murein DD-endopeptidase MepM/ murein hydrolase activator NlpD